MELKERARNYAANKALEAITKAIEQAYVDGYTDGHEDAKNDIVYVNDDNKYIDLGLPSGTRWSNGLIRDKENIQFMPYNEASKLNIPTKAQLDELLSVCHLENGTYNTGRFYTDVIGPNGNSIRLTAEGMKKVYKLECITNILFWLKSDGVYESDDRPSYFRNVNRSDYEMTFSGFKLPILLVK